MWIEVHLMRWTIIFLQILFLYRHCQLNIIVVVVVVVVIMCCNVITLYVAYVANKLFHYYYYKQEHNPAVSKILRPDHTLNNWLHYNR